MAIQLNGRVVELLLVQNTGSNAIYTNDPLSWINGPAIPNELDLSPYLISLDELSWNVEETLTKMSIGGLSFSCWDDGTITNFLEHGLTQYSNGTYVVTNGSLYWPWVILSIDGGVVWTGLIRESPVKTEEAGSLELQFSAVDWSSMLDNLRVEAGATEFDRRQTFRYGSGYAMGGDVDARSVYNKELRRNHDRTTVCLPEDQQNNFKVGDWVYFHNYSTFTQYNKLYPIEGAQLVNVGGLGNRWCIYLGGGFWWSENPGDKQNFGQNSVVNRAYATTSNPLNGTDLPIFIAAESWVADTAGETNPKTSIVLQHVQGLLPGDKLDKVTSNMVDGDSSYTVTVVDVDPIGKIIYIDKPIDQNLVSGVTSFQLQAESLREAILVPVLSLLSKALILPIGSLAYVDYSSFHPQDLPSQCFSFISGRSPVTQHTRTETIVDVSDIQVSLTDFQVKGNGKQWSGDLINGWAPLGSWSATVPWTDQLTSAPQYLMPFEDLPQESIMKTPVRGKTRYPGLYGYDDDPRYDPTDLLESEVLYKQVYDYSNLRRYLFRFTDGRSLTVQGWNGTSWYTINGLSIDNVGFPVDMVSMPGTTSAVGGGNGLLALYGDGTVKTILATTTLTGALQGDAVANNRLQANLIQTSNGIYYSTPTGYGTIRVVGGQLQIKWRQIIDVSNTTVLFQTITPITPFVYSHNVICALAKVSYKKSISDAQFTQDTYFLQLDPDISTANPILFADYICPALPRNAMMMLGPDGDILGYMGSRLFQIAPRIPDTVERFTATNQSFAALLEFVGAMVNAVPIPKLGKISFYSRGYAPTATNVTVDVVSQTTKRWNKNLTSTVVIKGLDDCVGVAVSETQLCGQTISYSNDTWIRNSSQARAIAQAMLSFFEVPRHELEMVWYSESTPMAFESLYPMQTITINGGTTEYYLTGLAINYSDRTARATLLEVNPA